MIYVTIGTVKAANFFCPQGLKVVLFFSWRTYRGTFWHTSSNFYLFKNMISTRPKKDRTVLFQLFPVIYRYLSRVLFFYFFHYFPSSIRISDSRIEYLGHILHHPTWPEFLICFNNSRSLRIISSPFRRAAPRARWPELALAESAHRLHQFIPHLLHRHISPLWN